ncbi:hypothetical protein D9619_011964 [Psilocybe cf. subviscida]|uniref:NACHT domain-containing protein n=1 Tax=Psilocybe cf. subviscida TaxID=2480587 RepID=A0A8H5B0J2_9AGAR|nr:hypothetical protein D9619_011964 [Psilocybe cf. subviscida]
MQAASRIIGFQRCDAPPQSSRSNDQPFPPCALADHIAPTFLSFSQALPRMSQSVSGNPGPRNVDGVAIFRDATNISIHGGNFIANASGGTDKKKKIADAMALLESRAEMGAPYDAAAREDVPKCQEQTRVAIIEGIHKWANSQEPGAPPLMWMYGPAGSGKTTIMQTVAETFDKEGSLAVSFFFSRLSAARPTDKENFVITMAHQLSLCIPALQQPLADALLSKSILTKSLTKQLDSLIINPLKTLDPAEVGPRCIFRVDGLDECNGNTAQRDVLDLLERLLDQAPHRVRILVASRSLSHIQPFFVRASIGERTQTTPLDNDYQSNEDIYQYFVSKFEEIRGEHPARRGLPSEWPSLTDIYALERRASGQFIYASVVTKFIADHGRHPDESLQTIIRSKAGGNARPYEELDAVYAQVLSTIEPQNLEFVYTLIGCLVLGKGKYCFAKVSQKQATVQLDSLFMIPPGTTASRTNRICPLITAGSHGMKFSHAYFPEYLLDRSRSKQFFLDMPKLHCRLARMWFKSYSEHFKHHTRKETTNSGAASYELQQYQSASLPRDVIVHCLEAEWTPELQQDILAFDLQTALLIISPPTYLLSDRDFGLNSAFLWVGFTFWLQQHVGIFDSPETYRSVLNDIITKHLQSTAHTEFLRGCIQSWLPVSQISPADRRVIASILTWYNHIGTLLCQNRPWTNKYSSLEAHRRFIAAFTDLPTNFKDVQEALCIWLCRTLVPDAAMDGALFSDGAIYAEMVLRYTNHSLPSDSNLLKALCKASPDDELSTHLKNSLQPERNTRNLDAESADAETEFILLVCIYLFECGIPVVSQHRHEPEFDPRNNWCCPICLVFDPFKEEWADTELSRDPPVKPDAVPVQIAEERAPRFLQIGLVRQFIPGVPRLWLQTWIFWFADMVIRFFPVVA